jgi:hypothetical protein
MLQQISIDSGKVETFGYDQPARLISLLNTATGLQGIVNPTIKQHKSKISL